MSDKVLRLQRKFLYEDGMMWTGDNTEALIAWVKSNGGIASWFKGSGDSPYIIIQTSCCGRALHPGDYVTLDGCGEFYVYKKKALDALFDRAGKNETRAETGDL